MEVIFTSGIFLSFFIVVLLLTKKPKALTDKILAVWISIIGIHLLGFYFNQLGYWETYPHLIGTTAPMPLLHGPMLFLYTLYSLRYDRKIRPVDYLHFAPALAAYLYMSNFFFFYTPEEKRLLDNGEMEEYMLFSIVLLIAILISRITYSVAKNRKAINQMNLALKENFKFLKKSCIGIVPRKFTFIIFTPLCFLNLIMSLAFNTRWAETFISNHALNAREEMRIISLKFLEMAKEKGFELKEFKKIVNLI